MEKLLIVCDDKDDIIYANNTFLTFFNLKVGEVIMKKPPELFQVFEDRGEKIFVIREGKASWVQRKKSS